MSDELTPVRCGCGGEAVMYDNEVRHECGISHFVVECQKCGIITKWHATEAEAIEAWNRAMGERTAKVTKGKWEVQPSTGDDRPFIWWKCSECGHVIFSETERDRREFHAFCGRCGAEMSR